MTRHPVHSDDGQARNTQDKPASLSQRTFAAFGWQFVTAFSKIVLRLSVLVVLARLLPVKAFGLITQSLMVIGLAGMVLEIGLSPALIQRKDLTDIHIRVGFTLSVVGGLLMTLGMWVGAPIAARIFESDEIVSLIRLLSFTFLFTSLGSTATALLQRRLNFRAFFWVETVSFVLGYTAVGLLLGLLGYGVWSLAWAGVAQTLLSAILAFAISPHPIRPSFAIDEAKHLLRFGVGMSLARVMNYSANNGDYFVVGRWLGAQSLGLYSRAYQLMTLPVSEFSSIISRVLFPAYAEVQNEPERLRRAFLRSVSLTAMVVLPLLVGMAIAAPEIIRGIFGPKWTDAIGAFQILCFGGFFRAMYNQGDALARARGAVYAQLWRHALYAITVFIGSVAGSRWGIEGVAVSVVGALLLMFILMTHLSLKLVQVGLKQYLAAQMPGAILGLLVATVALPLTLALRATGLHDLAILGVTIITCALGVGGAVLLFPPSLLGETPGWTLYQLGQMCSRRLPASVR
jgi:O-antigen/teichoic acid export membrane protein